MNSAGVMQRRGFLAIMLLGAVILTVYLVHAQVSDGGGKREARAAGAVSEANPSPSGSPNGPVYNAGGDGYGGASATAPSATSAAPTPSPGTTPVGVKVT